jgi:nicotinamidase-related amidase
MGFTTGGARPVPRLVLPGTTVHMAIDMQRVFAERTSWHMPGFDAIVPKVAAIAAAMPGRNVFTRFVVPHTAEHATGQWQNYYRRWHEFTGAVMPAELVDIVEGLAPYATPETLIDKLTYSVFEAPDCAPRLAALGATTIIFTGVETDVCVLASLMTAVDRGYRVLAVSDAVGSSAAEGHHATLTQVLTRLPDQVEIVTAAEVLEAIQEGKEELLF